MERPHHNLKLIIPSKENELFSIKKYQKKPADIFSNSFFSTYYNLFNKTKNSLPAFNNKKKFEESLFENNSKNKTNYNISNNSKLFKIPYPSFSNNKKIPGIYKNSIKLVKYPKIQRDNFTLYNYNKNNFPKSRDEEKTFNNTFSNSKINAETQTYLLNKNKTIYKERNHLVTINLTPIKKEPKVKYRYKLYKFDIVKKVKNVLKKKLGINNFDTILNNMIRLIEIRDEHNKDIKYDKVTNLLLDEIYNLIYSKAKKKRNKVKHKSVSTSMSKNYIKIKNIKLDNNEEQITPIRKNIRFKTFTPEVETFQVKYSFNSEVGNKVEDKEYINYNNNLYILKNDMPDEIKESKNELDLDEIEDDDSDIPSQRMKSKYHNLLNKLNERKVQQKRNINFGVNNYTKSNYNNNINNNINNNNNKTNNITNQNNSMNNDFIYGKSNNSLISNFFKQGTKKEISNKINNLNNGNINILDLLGDIISNIEKEPKSIEKIDKGQNKHKQKEVDKKDKNNNQNNTNYRNKSFSNKEVKIQYEKYFKNEKLINLLKKFSKLENIEEENFEDENISDENYDISVEKEEQKRNSNNKENEENELNSIDEYIIKKNIDIDKRKRKIRKARTFIIRKIDFCIEIIKNICEEVNLPKKNKEELFNIFTNLKNIINQPEITKTEEIVLNKSLKTINAFIRQYLIDMQKSELTKTKNKFLLAKYFKTNLNDKLNEIFNLISENNSEQPPEKTIQKKSRKKPQNLQKKKKLIFDNSYLYKTTEKKQILIKSNILAEEITSKDINKEKKSINSPFQYHKQKKNLNYKKRKEIIKIDKKAEGLKFILPIGGKVLTEEEKKIERENLLDRRLKAFFEEIKILKNIKVNETEKLNYLIDKEIDKFDYSHAKTIEARKYNFYEELKIKGNKSIKEKRLFNAQRYLSFQSPVIFNTYKKNM